MAQKDRFPARLAPKAVSIAKGKEQTMARSKRTERSTALYETILKLKDPEECRRFFRDLCTGEDLAHYAAGAVVQHGPAHPADGGAAGTGLVQDVQIDQPLLQVDLFWIVFQVSGKKSVKTKFSCLPSRFNVLI